MKWKNHEKNSGKSRLKIIVEIYCDLGDSSTVTPLLFVQSTEEGSNIPQMCESRKRRENSESTIENSMLRYDEVETSSR